MLVAQNPRKNILKLDKVRSYDMYVPLVSASNKKITYEEAKILVASFDEQIQELLAEEEQEIEKAQKAKDAKQAEKRASENIKDLAREKARKEVYLAREKIIAEEEAARKTKYL